MAKWRVIAEQRQRFTVIVEAESEREADAAALAKINDGLWEGSRIVDVQALSAIQEEIMREPELPLS